LLDAMLKKLLLELSPRQTWALVALACAGLLGFGLYLQHVVGLSLAPCALFSVTP
jgi:disulfide bond formation protein DsbB